MGYNSLRTAALSFGMLLALSGGSQAADSTQVVIPAEHEDHAPAPMPPRFRIMSTELSGPVFANADGKTLYYWPFTAMRNGVTGDPLNQSICTGEKRTQTAGLMSPYPPGLELPELDKRKSCTDVWTPELAADDAKPVGAFTVITRPDGKKQWAYIGHALYTSYLDKVPGDVLAATTMREAGDGPAARQVATAPSLLPAGFAVISTTLGRMLLTDKEYSLYTSDRDGPLKSNCDAVCTRTWTPVLASALAQPLGEWTVFKNSAGMLQWAYRKKPLYTYAPDSEFHSQEGSDIPGWHNVYAQKAPAPPAEFTFQDSIAGVVLADAKGKTLYTYTCADDSVDQLSCDQVDSPQVYRLAICGGGQVDRCLHDWPYVTASATTQSLSRTWQVLEINPRTGHLAQPGEPSLRVWAYLGRPVYTNAGDKLAGDIYGNANGEFGGNRNGFHALFVRTEFTR